MHCREKAADDLEPAVPKKRILDFKFSVFLPKLYTTCCAIVSDIISLNDNRLQPGNDYSEGATSALPVSESSNLPFTADSITPQQLGYGYLEPSSEAAIGY